MRARSLSPDSVQQLPSRSNSIVTIEPVIFESAREVFAVVGYSHHAESVEAIAFDVRLFILHEEELAGMP